MLKLKQIKTKQKGAALIIFAVIFALVASAYLLSSLEGGTQKVEREKTTSASLAKAKAGLIGYSVSYRRPGSMPCPDTNNDGVTDPNGNIDCYSNIGRLPWRTLGLEDLRDGNGDRLWYSISSNFRNVPSTIIINSENTQGNLSICPSSGCGNSSPIPTTPTIFPFPLLTKQAAIVFSSGNPVAGQNRADGSDVNPNPLLNLDATKKPANYLESITNGANQFNNATGSNNGNDFIIGEISNSFNDRLLTINTSEIFSNVDKRMLARQTLHELAFCLVEYANRNAATNDKRLPWPAPLTMADYSNPTSYDDVSTRYTGRMPYHIADSTINPPAHNWSTNGPTTRNKMESCSKWPEWWNSWKTFIFFAVSKDFANDSSAPQSCSGNCLRVDGIGPFAAVVIFSGKKLATQNRVTNFDLANPLNFLEDKNAAEISNNSGVGDYTKITNAAQNDITICIRQNLTIDLTCLTP